MMMQPSGDWWLLPLLMPLVMIVFALLILGAVRAASSPARPTGRKAGRRARQGDERERDERPLSLLRQRYVRGEIDLAEFERRVELLIRHEPTAGRGALAPGRE